MQRGNITKNKRFVPTDLQLRLIKTIAETNCGMGYDGYLDLDYIMMYEGLADTGPVRRMIVRLLETLVKQGYVRKFKKQGHVVYAAID